MIPIRWMQGVSVTLILVVLSTALGCSSGGKDASTKDTSPLEGTPTSGRLRSSGKDASAKDASAKYADTDPVRYKFKEGEKLRYVTESKTTTQAIIPGEQGTKIDNTVVADIVWEITGVEKDGRANVTATLDRVRLTADMPMGKMEYDSKSDKEPEDEFVRTITKSFKTVVGGQATLTVDAKGQVSNVKYLGKLAGAEMARNMYATVLQGIAVQLLRLPHEQMKKGDTWTDKAPFPVSDGSTSLQQTCVWEGPEEHDGRHVDRIAIQIAGESDPQPGRLGEKFTIKGGKGAAYFDRNAGRMLELTVTMTSESEKQLGAKTYTKRFENVTTMKLVENEK